MQHGACSGGTGTAAHLAAGVVPPLYVLNGHGRIQGDSQWLTLSWRICQQPVSHHQPHPVCPSLLQHTFQCPDAGPHRHAAPPRPSESVVDTRVPAAHTVSIPSRRGTPLKTNWPHTDSHVQATTNCTQTRLTSTHWRRLTSACPLVSSRCAARGTRGVCPIPVPAHFDSTGGCQPARL